MIHSLIGQVSDSFNTVLQVVYLLSFLLFMMYGQKIQVWMMLRDIATSIGKLKIVKEEARHLAIDSVTGFREKESDPTPRIDHLLEYRTHMPVSLDPSGIVPKIEHLVDVRDQRFRNEVKLLAPEANMIQASNLEGVLEVALGLNTIYRFVNHWYLLGKKTMSLYVLMQVQMQLPLIMQMAEAWAAAGKAFAEGQPIGDGAGALAAARMMHGLEVKEIAKNMVAAQTAIEGRTVYILKAAGPGAETGKVGDAIKRIIEENEGRIEMVIMIDAAQKLEGEESGSTAEGTGAFIGGLGVAGFKIEEVALKYKTPVNGIAIKQSFQESVAPMTKEINDGVNVAIARTKRIIHEETSEGNVVIVVGVGNTVGIGQ